MHVTLMDKLLLEADQAGMSREHVLEQSHYASHNVEEVMAKRFTEVVAQVEAEIGAPEQTIQVDREDGKHVPIPQWLQETVKKSSAVKMRRVAFWKRGEGYSYVALKVELDSKDRPNYYNLVLGSRRKLSTKINVDTMRKKKDWWSGLLWFMKGD
jgi:hypothetical protein